LRKRLSSIRLSPAGTGSGISHFTGSESCGKRETLCMKKMEKGFHLTQALREIWNLAKNTVRRALSVNRSNIAAIGTDLYPA